MNNPGEAPLYPFLRRYHFLGKRSAAAASLLRIRVLEGEALVHQALFVIENHAVQVNEGLRIDKDANVFKLKDAIAFARLRVETDVVTQSRTTTTLHTQTQSALGWRDVFLRHRQANAGQRLVRHLNAFGSGGGRLRRIFNVDRAHGCVAARRTE